MFLLKTENGLKIPYILDISFSFVIEVYEDLSIDYKRITDVYSLIF